MLVSLTMISEQKLLQNFHSGNRKEIIFYQYHVDIFVKNNNNNNN